MNHCYITLQQRLRKHLGKQLAIDAVDFSSETGVLQKVYKRTWIRVTGVYFVAKSLNQIILYQIPTNVPGRMIFVRSTYRGTFSAKLICIGIDYLEVIVDEGAAGSRRLLIPLDKIVSIEDD